MTMIKLCIFDFDGTLCASHDAILQCMGLTFDHYDHPRPTREVLDTAIRKSIGVAETFAALHQTGLTVEESLAWRESYRTIYNDGEGLARSRLYDGVEDILEHVKSLNIPAIILSNKGEQAVLHALAHFNLGSHFEMVIAERDGVVLKPDPSTYHELIAPKYAHIAPHEMLMIGDAPPDLLYARNIGAQSCWARYGHGDHALCMAHTPDHIIDGLSDLKKILI
jgi:phosphoglycolate phosphatase